MNTFLNTLITVSSLAAVLWIIAQLKDRAGKTFRPILLTAVILGAISIFIATFLFRSLYFNLVYQISYFQGSSNIYLAAILNVVIFELVKYAVFRIYIYPKKEYANIINGILFYIAIALGAVIMRGTMLFARQLYSFHNTNMDFQYMPAINILGIIMSMAAISVLSAIIAGYFIGVEKVKEEGGMELHMFAIGGAVLFNVIFIFLFNWMSPISDILKSLILLGGAFAFYKFQKQIPQPPGAVDKLDKEKR